MTLQVRPSEAFSPLLDEYRSRTPRSSDMHQDMSGAFAAGETRTVTHYWPYPVAIASADGPYVTDSDGNVYLDLANNMASLVHGHRFPPIVRAVSETLDTLGTAPAGSHEHLLRFGQLLVERYPAFELIRLTNSGSEAALLALRIARLVTDRSRIVMFEGGYHGMASEFTDQHPSVVRVPFNDAAAAAQAIDPSVAAVFAEPFLGHAGVIPAHPEFLQVLRGLATDAGALFVLDETQSLRDHYTAHHGVLGLSPDMVMMGKSIGGGLPIGVLGGRADLIEAASAACDNGLSHSGTFNGNALSAAAGYQAMVALTADAIAGLNGRAAWLAGELEAAGQRLQIPLVVTRSGSTMCIHFLDRAPTNSVEAAPQLEIARWFHIAALLEGVAVIKGGRLNLSTVLTEPDLMIGRDALIRSLDRVAALSDSANGRH
jgi:glutamate-1-semialdehyde 2,1-aminomutase